MNFKRFLSMAVAAATIISAVSVTNVFAAEPTFKIGTPIDITTNKAVTEYTPGMIVEVPIDVENVDSGKLSMAQFHMYYDGSVFTSGAAVSSTAGRAYFSSHKDYVARDPVSTTKMIGRHNMNEDLFGDGSFLEPAGAFSGNLNNDVATGTPSVAMLWNLTGADPIPVNESEPEFYLLFTVKDDFDADSLSLNAGTNGLTNSGMFALNALYLDETATNNHANLAGTQNEAKVNACFGAFKVTVNNDDLVAASKWVSAITANVYTDSSKTTPLAENVALTVYTNADGTTVYEFPTRITANAANVDSAYVEIVATLSDETGEANNGTEVIAAKTISMNSTVADYE